MKSERDLLQNKVDRLDCGKYEEQIKSISEERTTMRDSFMTQICQLSEEIARLKSGEPEPENLMTEEESPRKGDIRRL
jgi:hypothetical protein